MHTLTVNAVHSNDARYTCANRVEVLSTRGVVPCDSIEIECLNDIATESNVLQITREAVCVMDNNNNNIDVALLNIPAHEYITPIQIGIYTCIHIRTYYLISS